MPRERASGEPLDLLTGIRAGMKLARMTDLEFARAQMGMSLAFHILFATVGIGMPVLMAMAEGMHLRGRNPVHRELARRWARGTAILFAVGAVSGTVLSFELDALRQPYSTNSPTAMAQSDL